MFSQTEFASDQTCCARQAVSLFHFLYNVSLYRNRKEEHTMDSTRYFDALHNAMSAQHAGSQLLLTVQLLDACGKDAYLELRSLPGEQSLVLCYSTIGRRELDFQLFRKGWLQCHNANGQLTGRFPSRADQLLEEVDFRAHCRDERLDATLSPRILQELKGLSGTDFQSRAPQNTRTAAQITVDSFVGSGAHWCYWTQQPAPCLPLAAILYELAESLAGGERRILQADPQAAQLAAQWQSDAVRVFFHPAVSAASFPRPSSPASRPVRACAHSKSWQSILTVMASM